MTVIQRFGGALNLNVHFHGLVLDGVYGRGADGALTFHPLPPPTDATLEALCATVRRRVKRLLVRRGPWDDDEDGGRPTELDEAPPLGDLYEASVRQRAGSGPRAGRPLERVGATLALEPGDRLGAKARVAGFDIHAGVVVAAAERDRLEHLCRYLLRPPLAHDRLEERPDGTLWLKLKTRWADGTTHLRLRPLELLERLAALVPRPRSNQILYHGVLAANAKWRSEIVPTPGADRTGQAAPKRAAGGCNHGWAELMRRGLDLDVLDCPRGCGGRLRFVATLEQPAVIERILRHLGLPTERMVPRPARAPPLDLDPVA